MNCRSKIFIAKGGSLGLVVMGDDSCLRGCGFKSWCWTFLAMNCCKNCIVCLKRSKINEREAGVSPFLTFYYATTMMIFYESRLYYILLSTIT